MRQDPLPQPLDDVISCPRHHLDPGVGNVVLPPASVSGGGFRVQLTEEHEGLGRDVARIEAGVRVEGRRNAAEDQSVDSGRRGRCQHRSRQSGPTPADRGEDPGGRS